MKEFALLNCQERAPRLKFQLKTEKMSSSFIKEQNFELFEFLNSAAVSFLLTIINVGQGMQRQCLIIRCKLGDFLILDFSGEQKIADEN